MFCFNPFSYFFKSFIRLFTKKFFWVILILLLICIGWALYDKGVFAESTDLQYYYEGNVYKLHIYHEGKGFFVVCNADGSPYSVVYCSQYRDVSTWRYYDSSNSVSPVQTNGETWSLLYELKEDGIYKSKGSAIWQASGNYALGENRFIGYTSRNIYLNSTNDIYLNADSYNKISDYSEPFIENDSSTINNWSFDYLKINSGSIGYVYDNPITGTTSYAIVNLKYTYNGITYTQQISSGYISNWSTTNFIVEFPRTSLLNSVNIENDKSVDFYLEVKKDYVSDIIYSLGTYTFALTTDEQEQIQQDSDKALQGEILGAQQETNNKLDNIENTITDTSVPPDSDFDLPTIEVNDSTANFFDTLFTGIYNAFNTNEDTTISFTIFSKTITINSADFRMLNDSRFTILRNLLESSWYFAIGYMILKDIRHIFDKIKTGNIENAVSNDIKADMV